MPCWIHLLWVGIPSLLPTAVTPVFSLHHHATVHRPGLPGDVARAGRGEERDHLGHVLGRAEPAEWDARLELGLGGLGQLVRHLGGDVAGAYGIHRDRAPGELARERLGEPEQARLARGVV